MQRSGFGIVGGFQAAVLSVLIGLAGCSSGNKSYEQGMKTGSNLQELARKIEAAEKQIDTTLSQADALVNAPGTNPRKQFDQYRKSLDTLESQAADIRDLANDMNKRADAYFAQWEKDVAEIKNEEIKNVTAQRRNERMAQFNGVRSHFAQVRDAFKPFLADLQDIEQALSVELTPGSMEALKPFVTRAREDAVPLEKALDDLRAKFQELGVSMMPTGKS